MLQVGDDGSRGRGVSRRGLLDRLRALGAPAWSLAALQAARAVGLASRALLPLAPGSQVGLDEKVAAAAAAGAVVSLVAARMRAALLADAVSGVLFVTLLIAHSTTPAGALVSAGALWLLATWVACFQPPKVTAGFVVLVAAAATTGFAVNGNPSPLVWSAAVVAMVSASSGILAYLVWSLRRAAMSDELTGLANRRGLIEAVATGSRNTVCSAVAVDLDGLKAVNDAHGHAAGDAVIAGFAAELRGAVRPGDVLARVGGDEFVVVLAGAGEEAAARWVERVRAGSAYRWSHGVAERGAGERLEVALSRADRELCAAKVSRRAGRRALG